jgi:hypothetical protein
VICALLAAVGLSLAAAESRADLFDFLRPKRTAAVARAQSPDGRAFGAGGQTGWGYDANPGGNNGSYDFSGGGLTVNCGECDRHQGRVSFCRKLCHQTYYPRAAPYCMPEWGWNQTCWRRMKDNYNCPRPDFHGSSPEPPASLPPQTPVMPPATTYLPVPRFQVNRPVSYGQRQRFPERSPVHGRNGTGPIPEPESQAGEWNYEEEAAIQTDRVQPGAAQPVTAPPREQGHARYYLSPGMRR